MARQRLSREESSAQTRCELLEAAAEVFAERGFGGATVEQVVERAGYTRGAFYKNFADKEAAFLTLLDQRLSQSITDVGRIVADAHAPEELLDGLRERSLRRQDGCSWYLLLNEFHLYALRNPEVRSRLAARERAEREALARGVTQQFSNLGLTPPAPPMELALILQCLESGMELEQMIDPEGIPRGSYLDALALLLDAGAALARERRATPPDSNAARSPFR
jgi:AcrR family transcriptional regulator